MSVSDHPPAESSVQVDNPTARVTAWHFTPGASTGHHRHEYDYVVVPLTTGRVLIQSADGQAPGGLIAGQAYFRHSGVEHEVVNDNDFEITFVEIELKR